MKVVDILLLRGSENYLKVDEDIPGEGWANWYAQKSRATIYRSFHKVSKFHLTDTSKTQKGSCRFVDNHTLPERGSNNQTLLILTAHRDQMFFEVDR